MGWHGTSEAVGAGAQWKWRQTKAQECQMEIMLQSPRGIRHVINTGWGVLSGRLCSQGTPQKHKAWGPNTRPLGRGVSLVKFILICCLVTINVDKLKNALKI